MVDKCDKVLTMLIVEQGVVEYESQLTSMEDVNLRTKRGGIAARHTNVGKLYWRMGPPCIASIVQGWRRDFRIMSNALRLPRGMSSSSTHEDSEDGNIDEEQRIQLVTLGFDGPLYICVAHLTQLRLDMEMRTRGSVSWNLLSFPL
jgi:hypothetical protein